MPFLKIEVYLRASVGQTFKQRAQLKQSAGNLFLSTRPSAASNGHAFIQAPHWVHFSLSIRTRNMLNRSAIQETSPKGQMN